MAMTPITLANLTRAINKLKEYFVQIKDSVRSVNGNRPNSEGDINVNRVNFAGELESYSTQYNQGEFIQRTSGGTASIEDGDAWLINVKGKGVKTGKVDEVLNMTVTPMPREEGETPITADIDAAVFKAYVTTSQTVTLNYTTAWSADPATYGITVTGTPLAGDQIVVVYVKEELGTLTFSYPTSLVSTGWNLFNYTTGLAKVLKYSEVYGFRIEGAYSAIQFSPNGSSDWSDLSVISGNITGFPDGWTDGFIKVTGGNSTTTAVYMTWSDWGSGYKWDGEQEGAFSAYSETVVNLSSLFTDENCPFPYGLLECGSAQDEINLNIGQAISRVERMENTEENMTIARQSGREYDFDENYIYLVRETAVTTTITIDGSYTVSDHGLEYFEGTTIPAVAQSIYGSSLKNKLERDVLTLSQQSLTSTQKTQVQANIGLNIANNLTTTGGGYVLDARQGKTLNDHFAVLGSSTEPLTTLADIPLNSIGSVVLSASISPCGQLRQHTFIKTGVSANRYTLILIDQYDYCLYLNNYYDGTWKGWRQAVASGCGFLPSGTNLNNLIIPGVYGISNSNSYTGLPTGVGGGILEVISPKTSGEYTIQRLQVASSIYERYRLNSSGTSFGSWYKYIGTEVT